MARIGTIGSTITLGIKFYRDGSLFDPFSISTVGIYSQAVGGTAITDLTPSKVSTGHYQVQWTTPSTLIAGVFYDEWVWVGEESMGTNTQRYSFTLSADETDDSDNVVSVTTCRSHPSWIGRMGLTRVDDVGNGTGVALVWEEARTADSDQQIHYNIYAADTRFDLLESDPVAITTAQYVIINIPPGNLYYFAVKATEFDTDIDITELEQIGINLYQYPTSVALLTDLPEAQDGYTITIDGDISHYPAVGELLINTEIIRYDSVNLTLNAFIISANNRAITSTTLQEHSIGDTVKLWKGIEEGNSVIRQSISAWHQVQAQDDDAIGQYNADADGYRIAGEDVITTNLTAADESNADFPAFDFCGLHRPSLQSTFSGECVGSYVGGEFGGFRGLNLQERNIARLDTMLQVTGEPVILLRRKWTGRRCKCFGLQREHQRSRCDRCYGTGFETGFDRFFNVRAVSELRRNTVGYILVRVAPWTDDIDIIGNQGISADVELSGWTLPFPTMKDRDIIIRFDENFTEEFRYEVLNVIRNKTTFSQTGQQTFKLRRLNKTEIIYTYDYADEDNFLTIP